jgi:hypothetical protein
MCLYKHLMVIDMTVVLYCTLYQRLHAEALMFFYLAKPVAALRRTAQNVMLSAATVHVLAMAPRLAASQHDMISDMIASESLKTVDMAAAAGCSDCTICSIWSNLCCFGSSRAPFNGGGRRWQITPVMLDALKERLLEKPGMYQDEMVLFLYDEFEIIVNNSAVSRALVLIGWTKKATWQIAKERNADLWDYYLHNLSVFQSHHLVYVDESGCDKRIGFRRTGWSPLGVAPVQIAQFY